MAKRKVYHVTPHEDGWQVKEEGASRASAVRKTKAEAVSKGRELAKKPAEGQIKIHKQDGTIETEHTYKNDPRRTRG